MANQNIQTHLQSKLPYSGIFVSLIASDITELISLKLECTDADELYLYNLYTTAIVVILFYSFFPINDLLNFYVKPKNVVKKVKPIKKPTNKQIGTRLNYTP